MTEPDSASNDPDADEDERGRSLASGVIGDSALPLGLLVGSAIAGAAMLFSARLNYDMGWLLVGTRRLLDGANLYAEGFVDVNPPLILYLLSPAVTFARLADISEILAVRLYLLAAVAISLFACARLVSALCDPRERLRGRYFAAALGFVLLVWPAAFHGTESPAFAQREHWILLLLFPYLVATAIRLRGHALSPWVAVAVGIGAGLAVSMKPHFLATIVLLEALRIAVSRSVGPVLRGELVVLGGVGIAYLASVWILAPAYLDEALPLALRTYWAYQAPTLQLMSPASLTLLALALAGVLAVPRGGGLRCLGLVLWVSTLGFYIAYLLGGTYWSYHRLPFRSAGLLCLLLPAIVRLPAANGSQRLGGPARAAVSLGAAAAVLVVLGLSPTQPGSLLRAAGQPPTEDVHEILERVVRDHADGRTILFLSTTVSPAFPLVNYADVDWTLRLSCLWPLPAIIRWVAQPGRYGDRLSETQATEVASYLRRILVEDMGARPPELVFVDRAPEKQGLAGIEIDLLEFLNRDPAFARRWRSYEPLMKVPHFDVYRRRRLADGAAPQGVEF